MALRQTSGKRIQARVSLQAASKQDPVVFSATQAEEYRARREQKMKDLRRRAKALGKAKAPLGVKRLARIACRPISTAQWSPFTFG